MNSPSPNPGCGIAAPHRYTLETELRVDGTTTDTHRTTFGIRTYRFDPDEGFSLNGTHAKIKGVDLHHDLGALGAAISIDAVRRQMTVMKSMGVNAFRTSHNPPSPQMIQVCEELGIVMMVEAFDCWRTGKTTYDYGRFFDEWCEKDATEMVLAARNSPAVVLWSIGNEIPDSTSTAGLAMADRIIGGLDGAVDTTHSLPASVEVAVWDGHTYLPVDGATVDWAASSDTPTVITFGPVRGSRIRLTLTSGHPDETRGAVRISRLEVPAG